MRLGDPALGIHIPVPPLHPTCLDTAIANARITIQRNYSNLCCHNWLLNPALHNIIGTDSNMVWFAARFARHPVRSNGKKLLGCVFPYGGSTNSNLPETTMLQRELKKHYLHAG